MRILWIAPLCLTLAACGGSGAPVTTIPSPPDGPTDPSTPTTGQPQTAAQMRSAANTLLSDYIDPVAFTTLSTVPSNLTATYDGYAYGTLSGNPSTITDTLMGAVSMDVALTASTATITGTMDDFYDDDDNAVSGQLTISGGTFDRAGDPNADSTLNINFAGTLTDAGQTLTVGGQLQGDFLGAGYEGVGGALLGQVNGYEINGGFIAER